MSHDVLDLFSAAAGGWSLGMHRAGFRTVAACEAVAWRRALYAENNPGVILYDDVRTLTADQLVSDLGRLPDIIVGSPPCQDISSANNAKGRGVDGPKSGLFFQATRIVRECRPRWVALENSSDLRVKGADRVLGELEADGYTCWPAVVRARDVGANHIRPRVWLLAFNADQVVEGAQRGLLGGPVAVRGGGDHVDAESVGHEGGRAWRRGPDGHGASPAEPGHDADPAEVGQPGISGSDAGRHRPTEGERAGSPSRGHGAHADQEGQLDRTFDAEMGWGQGAGGDPAEPWADWNGGLAAHLQLDDGLSAWVAGARVAVGGPRGTAAASLLVEAFGDAVVPQIPEAIGRAILRTEAALAALYGRAAA